MYIYGYDTLRAYQYEDYSQILSDRFQKEFKRNKGGKITYNSAEIHLSFPNGMTVVSFSIPKLLFSGCNIELAGINETLEAVELMTEILGIDFSKFHNSRLDITTNINSSIKARAFVKHLKNPPYFKGCSVEKKGIYYHTAAELKDSARVLTLYDKEDLLRIEARLFSKAELGQSANYLFKRHLKHEALVSELTKESFYANCVYYLNNLLLSAIPKCKTLAESEAIFDELRSSLDTNLRYTLPSNLLRNVC